MVKRDFYPKGSLGWWCIAAYEEGGFSWLAGITQADNPYTDKPCRNAWLEGWIRTDLEAYCSEKPDVAPGSQKG